VSWLPSPPARGIEADEPWTPAGLGAHAKSVRYLVVDEIVGGVVGLALCDWPSVDEQGRVRFRGAAKLLGAGRSELQHFLAMHRVPADGAGRAVRIGDVFAVEVIEGALDEVRDQLEEQSRLEPLLSPAKWIKPPVRDLTVVAREAAKISFYAAVAPTLGPSEAALVADLTGGEG
jgi:hypothetical protein